MKMLGFYFWGCKKQQIKYKKGKYILILNYNNRYIDHIYGKI